MKTLMWTRRSLVSGLSAGAAAVLAFGTTARAQAPAPRFQPARHVQDDWLNALPGGHRTFIDAATASGAGEGMLYANNLYVANKAGYGLSESDVAIVVCLRHFATVFAYNNAIWKKYGTPLSEIVQFSDPKTKQAPVINVFTSPDYGMTLSNLGNTIDSVVKRGTQFAVCEMATRFFSGQVASRVGANADAVYKELTSNLIPNSRMVAAGVVAVNRAQEYGYTLLTAL